MNHGYPRTLTRRQLEVIDAYIDAGGTKGAAHRLGIAPATVKATLTRARLVERVDTTPQLVRALTRRGDL